MNSADIKIGQHYRIRADHWAIDNCIVKVTAIDKDGMCEYEYEGRPGSPKIHVGYLQMP